MYTAPIRRKQLYLTDLLDDRLRERATVEGRSEAAVVRDALESYLAEIGLHSPDPILALAGLAGAGPAQGPQRSEDAT
jgi:hypothetical protein